MVSIVPASQLQSPCPLCPPRVCGLVGEIGLILRECLEAMGKEVSRILKEDSCLSGKWSICDQHLQFSSFKWNSVQVPKCLLQTMGENGQEGEVGQYSL
jgi:hypothetical protein